MTYMLCRDFSPFSPLAPFGQIAKFVTVIMFGADTDTFFFTTTMS